MSSNTQTIKITLPKPLGWQADVLAAARRFNVVCIGRRAGKTELGKILVARHDTLPHPVGWFSPTYKEMLEVWRDLSHILDPIIARQNATERRLEFVTGGVLEFWSLDNPKAGRSRKYRRVIIDEAAFVPDLYDIWSMSILPTLADMRGDAWIFSTPKGKNGFYKLWQMAHNRSDWAQWQMPTSVNPHIADSEIEMMRETMPERLYQQEILAEFIDDAGGVFRRVMDAATAVWQDRAVDGHQYVIGADWGKHNDFTVLTVGDVTTGQCVHIDRFNQIDYVIQAQRLKALAQRFNPTTIIAERNSIGEPVIELLWREGLPIQPFTTSNATKGAIIDALSVAFERGDIGIVNDPVLIAELQSYEMERLPSGMMRYNAPSGMHDDCVMSLALMWSGMQSGELVLFGV